MKTRIILSILFMAMLIFIGYNFAFTTIEEKVKGNSVAKCELRAKMNRNWEDQVVWTRQVAFNIIEDLPGTNVAMDRLFKTQHEISTSIANYYGSTAEEKLGSLFRTSAIQRMEMFKAIKLSEPNNIDLELINMKWKKNADDIAEFLAELNPFWKVIQRVRRNSCMSLCADSNSANSKTKHAATSNIPRDRNCMIATSKHQTSICAAGWNFTAQPHSKRKRQPTPELPS